MLNNPDIIDSICEYDVVVLIEQRNYSLFANVKKEIDYISNCNVKILGAIII